MRQAVGRRDLAFLAVAPALIALVWSGAALAALPAPVLFSPHNGKRLHTGPIALVVKVTIPGVTQVAVQISPKRDVSHGVLAFCDNEPCDNGLAVKWAGHPGLWIYRAHPTRYNSRHYWADTPGKYYWQADALGFNCARLPACEVYSGVETFSVVR